ncbi:MAG: hypothetical protein IAE99_10575 [Rhodothermales bacterium]|nr:hypothetical protein [Rhodothermales bacterium]MCA0269403.1 hypothetical protein [Bacteroidota bacterium]
MTSPFSLKIAQDQLVADIKAAIAEHATGQPLELDLSVDESDTPDVGALSTSAPGLNADVRRLLAAFNASDVAQGGPVLARHVTAFDSDGDGVATVTVRYSYSDEG